VEAVLAEQLQRLGWPSTAGPPEEPRQVLADTLAYVKRNRQRMDYPRYRRQGLPVTSAAVKSLIKQVNHRVKGTEKFWVCGGAAATGRWGQRGRPASCGELVLPFPGEKGCLGSGG
jgi:hypothetical protein